LHFQESRRTHGKTRGGRIASYLTDEQRSHAGWIGASKCEVIFERALRLNHRIFKFTVVVLCLAGLLPSAGCSKIPLGKSRDINKTWICDEEADSAMRRQDYDAGILLHQRFLEKEPENGFALYHLGYAYGQTGNHLKEVSCYEKAIGLGFQGERIYFNLGMAYGELNQGEKSIRAFRKALGIDPDSADNHFGLAMAYQRNSDDKFAEEEFLKATEIDPGHLDARLYLSMLYADMGDLQKARGQLRKILEIDPTNGIARQFLERIEKE
ncbi:MAG: tetratricopeptide repeat protein, partial [Deltaproteobacteria bacterium]|nr:tetratricopeptide repeat protein [Deltaproteobacteria bacterium]